MDVALEEARVSAARGEVPVGAVVVDAKGTVLAQAGNRTLELRDPTAHAEVLVLRTAAAEQRVPEIVPALGYGRVMVPEFRTHQGEAATAQVFGLHLVATHADSVAEECQTAGYLQSVDRRFRLQDGEALAVQGDPGVDPAANGHHTCHQALGEGDVTVAFGKQLLAEVQRLFEEASGLVVVRQA